MYKNKKMGAVAWAAALTVILAGSAGIITFAEETEDYVVCTVNGEELCNSDFADTYLYYLQMFEAAGYDVENETVLDYLTECAYNATIDAVLLRQGMTEDGYYDFSEEELEAFAEAGEESYQVYLMAYTEYYEEKYETEQDETYADAMLCATEYLTAAGFTAESLAESAKESSASDRFQEALMADVAFTDEDVKAYYEELVATDEEDYAENISLYEYVKYYTSTDIWYVPEGYRQVLQIVLDAEDEALEEKIADIYARAEDAESFRELVKEYTIDADGAEDSVLENGYYVHQDSIVWEEAVIEAIFSDDMQNPGDLTELTNDSGVHIFYYLEDLEGGAVELTEETEPYVRQKLEDETLDDKMQEYVNALAADAVILTIADPTW